MRVEEGRHQVEEMLGQRRLDCGDSRQWLGRTSLGSCLGR